MPTYMYLAVPVLVAEPAPLAAKYKEDRNLLPAGCDAVPIIVTKPGIFVGAP